MRKTVKLTFFSLGSSHQPNQVTLRFRLRQDRQGLYPVAEVGRKSWRKAMRKIGRAEYDAPRAYLNLWGKVQDETWNASDPLELVEGSPVMSYWYRDPAVRFTPTGRDREAFPGGSPGGAL